jgi:uncharacterized protein DUF4339
MSESEHPIEWYLAREGQQFGPLSDVELRKFIELGHLRSGDLLWRQGFAEWQPATNVFPPQRAAPAPQPQPQPQPQAQAQPQPQPARRPQEGEPAAAADPKTAPGRNQGVERSMTAHSVAPGGPGERGAPSQAASAAQQVMERSAPARSVAPVRPGGQPAAADMRARRAPASRTSLHAPADASSSRAPARRPRRFPWAGAIFSLGFAALAGGALALHQNGSLSVLMADFGLNDIADLAKGAGAAQGGRSATPTTQSIQAANNVDMKRSPFQGFSSSPEEIDANFQKSPLWRLIKAEFPDWYADQVKEVARLRGEQKDDKAIAQHLAGALVALRRKHVAEALSASAPRLRSVASSFLDNLGRLATNSIDACYAFISQGETSPAMVELLRDSDYTPHLQAQVVAVFQAIAEGRKSPRQQTAPRREDYDALASQLAKRGWTAADLQLFSDARALSHATPQKVCQMVQDWFAAQLSVKDEDVQMRLLVEALKPVVAG